MERWKRNGELSEEDESRLEQFETAIDLGIIDQARKAPTFSMEEVFGSTPLAGKVQRHRKK